MTDSGGFSSADASSGLPAGPAGCRGAVLVVILVALLIGLFIAAIWWMMRDVGAA